MDHMRTMTTSVNAHNVREIEIGPIQHATVEDQEHYWRTFKFCGIDLTWCEVSASAETHDALLLPEERARKPDSADVVRIAE